MLPSLYHKLSDISQIVHITIPVGTNYVLLVTIQLGRDWLIFAGEQNPMWYVACSTTDSAEDFVRGLRLLWRKQPSFLRGKGRALREYRLAGLKWLAFLVVQQQECHPCC
jgi:hypothetical protein